MAEWLLPVCSPDYAKQLGLYEQPENLTNACFIHTSESSGVQQLFSEWRYWCETNNVTLPYELRHYGFNHYQMALQAALSGMGVIMGRAILVESLLASGALVPLAESAIPAGRNYELICPKEHQQRPRVMVFNQWLRDEIASSSHLQSKEFATPT